jgi:hypothetical protein
LIDAGVARLRHQTGRRIARYQFLLVGRPGSSLRGRAEFCCRIGHKISYA